MGIDLLKTTGTPLDQQRFTWKELVQAPYSKLDDDAFTRVRVILMNGIESEALRFSHACARMNRELQLALARVRRVEQHQQTLVNWLNPADQSPLETTIGFEQVAIEVTASVAQHEPDPYLAQVYRFGLLEDFDHLYRYSALMDRRRGQGREQPPPELHGHPARAAHRASSTAHPRTTCASRYDRATAAPLTKLNALTIMAAEHQTHDYYMTIGPTFADPVARQLYAEIASIEEQHVTQYESLIDPDETWLEKWLLHEATEVYNYYSCVRVRDEPAHQGDLGALPRLRARPLPLVVDAVAPDREARPGGGAAGGRCPSPSSTRATASSCEQVLRDEVGLTAVGPEFVSMSSERTDGPSPMHRGVT